MNPLTGTLVGLLALAAIAGCWRWLFADFRRFHRRHDRTPPEPAEQLDLAASLRCLGGPPPMGHEMLGATPKLDAFSRRER